MARGLLTSGGELTEAGQALRDKVEAETDTLAAGPWRHLGDERTEQVISAGRELTRTALAAGALPQQGVFSPRRAR